MAVKTAKKPRLSYKELYHQLSPLSLCSTTYTGSIVNPDYIHIRLKGPVANIPALKNQKIQGTSILRPQAKVVFDIMTRVFQKSVNFEVPRYDAGVEVFCLVMCSYRPNTFDEDNVLTSVKDWLEPSFIRQKDRGWGVGIVPNDRCVNAYALKKKKTSLACDVTEIYLKRMDQVIKDRDSFLSKIIGRDISQLY